MTEVLHDPASEVENITPNKEEGFVVARDSVETILVSNDQERPDHQISAAEQLLNEARKSFTDTGKEQIAELKKDWEGLSMRERTGRIDKIIQNKVQSVNGNIALTHLAAITGKNRKELHIYRRLFRAPDNIWKLEEVGLLKPDDLGLIDVLLKVIKAEKKPHKLIFELAKLHAPLTEGAIQDVVLSTARSHIDIHRQEVDQRLNSNDVYMVDFASEYAKGCDGLKDVPLKFIPLDTPGYGKFKQRFNKDDDFVLFCEAGNSRRICCIHHKAVIAYKVHQAGFKWDEDEKIND